MNPVTGFGWVLKRRREELGLTQAQVIERAAASISRPQLANIEGGMETSIPTLAKLLDALGLTWAALDEPCEHTIVLKCTTCGEQREPAMSIDEAW